MLSWDRNRIETEHWEFAQVADFSEFKDFDCSDEDLNDFIRNDATQHKEELIAETYSFKFIDKRGQRTAPVSFISLSNDSLRLKTNRQKRSIPNKLRYPQFPAVKVARLGVHKDVQGKSIGTLLLELTKELFLTNNRTGCRFLTVEAYNKKRVTDFYKQNDFRYLHDDDKDDKTRIMFYDLKRFRPKDNG